MGDKKGLAQVALVDSFGTSGQILETLDKLVTIYESHGRFFIWTAEDAVKLREKHRICGVEIGSLPRQPNQNRCLGLPILLMKCEARLLFEKGLAEIIKEDHIVKDANAAEKIAAQRKKSYEEQVVLARASKRKEMEDNMEQITEGKRRKLTKKLGDTAENEQKISTLIAQEIASDMKRIDSYILPEGSSLIQIHRARFPDEATENWPDPVPWCYPDNKTDESRYHIYKYLWEQNYFITTGGKFGGDFVVYMGDPALFHSLYIVACKDFHEPINIMKIIQMGRLGQSVKKTFVVASVNYESNDKVVCISIQWAGF